VIDPALREVLDTFGGEIVSQIPSTLDGPEAAESLSRDGAGAPGAPLFLNNISHKQKNEVFSAPGLYWKKAVKCGDIVEVCEYERVLNANLLIPKSERRKGEEIAEEVKQNNRMVSQYRAKKQIRYLVNSNIGRHGDHKPVLFTLTYKDAISDFEEAN